MKPASAPASRRRFLKLGVAGAALLTLGGVAAWRWQPGFRDGRLTEPGRSVFRAVALSVLEGSLPDNAAARDALLERHAAHIEQTISQFPPATRADIAQLLGLLNVAPVRRWLTGLKTALADATPNEVSAALRFMRRSASTPRQQAYHALRDLTNAAFYAQPEHWRLMGYPGPIDV